MDKNKKEKLAKRGWIEVSVKELLGLGCKTMYFLISTDDDGDIRLHTYEDRAELLEDFADPEIGGSFSFEKLLSPEEAPLESDPFYWSWRFDGRHLLLIKGEVVVPQKKEVVTAWSVP